MKKSRINEKQVVKILAEADTGEFTVEKLCQKHGMAPATYYQWKKKFRGKQRRSNDPESIEQQAI